jgi:hypothetical protein
MTKPMIRIHDTETNEVIDREMTNLEYEQYSNEVTAKAEQIAAESAQKAAKLAILQQLGLTDEQAIVLGLLPKKELSTVILTDEATTI